MQEKTKKHFDHILDMYGGVDGGVSFVLFKNLVETMDARALEGDNAAEQIVDIVVKFSRLIEFAESGKCQNPK